MNKIKMLSLTATALIFSTLLVAPVAEARGRTGSIRVGGYTSHGKGSHYIGGYVSHTPRRR